MCRVKRIGGGFGGKETRSAFISTAVAVAAKHIGVPVKIMLDRDVDMAISGTRHPFYARYKVFDEIKTINNIKKIKFTGQYANNGII